MTIDQIGMIIALCVASFTIGIIVGLEINHNDI